MAEAIAVIGIISSIVQLIDFSSKVADRLNDFASSVNEVPRAFRHINTELPLITDSLRRIQDRAKSESLDERTIKALEPVIKDCYNEIGRLQSILDRAVPSADASSWERKKKALLSLGKDRRVEEIADSLERYVRVLTLHQVVEGSSGRPGLQSEPQPVAPRNLILIPYDRNSNFVGREDVFTHIAEVFNVKKGSQPKAALFGLGGIGKSQIALEYCYKWKELNTEGSIFWVHAATLARFEETYKRIASECGIMTREDAQVDTTQLVQNWLENRHDGPWLMIVDNIDDADVFFRATLSNGRSLSQCIPRTERGTLLFTTRSRDIAVDLIQPAMPTAVPVLTKSEGASLLSGRVAGHHPEEQVFELLKELEHIPLAITQAAAFMSKRRKTIPQYLELYRKSDATRLRMLNYEFSDHGRHDNALESVAKTWMISFENIQRANSRAADLLSLMSYYDRHKIPVALLHNEEEEDLFDFEDATALLCAFSLIESDEAGSSFDMHNLVQLATKLWLINDKKGEEDRWAFEALKLLACKFPAPEHHPTAEYWKLCASFLPHAQLILSHDFKNARPEVELERATLLLSVGRYSNWKGASMDSKAKTEESFKIRERILSEKHPATLQSLGQLAWISPWISEPDRAVELGRRCLALREQVLGKDHPDTIDCLSDLATALSMTNELEQAELMQRQAFEASERVLGLENADTLNCLCHLADTLGDQGKYEEAEVASRKAVTLKVKLLGEDNPSVYGDMHNLAVILSNQDDPAKNEEAMTMYRRVLELKEKVYGMGHVETLTTLMNLVILLDAAGKWEDVLELRTWFNDGVIVPEDSNPTFERLMIGLRSFHFHRPGSETSSDAGGDSGYEDVDVEDPQPEQDPEKDKRLEETIEDLRTVLGIHRYDRT